MANNRKQPRKRDNTTTNDYIKLTSPRQISSQIVDNKLGLAIGYMRLISSGIRNAV